MDSAEEKELKRLERNAAKYAYRRRVRKEHPKEYYATNRESILRRTSRYAKRNKEKGRAHSKVYRALKSGKLVRPSVCSECGEKGRIEAHHPDYNKPLEVVWLCHPCHDKISQAAVTLETVSGPSNL